MICPVCGFDRAVAPTCSQCQTPLSSAKTAESARRSKRQPPAEEKEDSLRFTAEDSSSKSKAEETPGSYSISTGPKAARKSPYLPEADSEAVIEISGTPPVKEKPSAARAEKPGPPRKQFSAEQPKAKEPPEKTPSLPSFSERSGGRAYRLDPAEADSEADVELPFPPVIENPRPQKAEIPESRKKQPDPAVRIKPEQIERVIVSTTPGIDGRLILAYQGIVTATVLVRGDRILRQFIQGITGDVASIRSSSLKEPFEKARRVALADLKVEAAKRGANAVVGLTISQAPASEGIWFHLVGTAVILKE